MSDAVFGAMFTADAVDACLDDGAYLQAMLDTEAALARACARAGLIPVPDADAISAACRADRFDAASIGHRARAHATPVIPLVDDLRAALPEPVRRSVHTGATSQDIIDTATSLVAKAALAPILDALDAVADRLALMADRHAADVQIGRTLLQRAEPMTFGLVCAGWMTGLTEARRGLARARDDLAVQLGGPVGTRAAYGADGSAIAADMAEALGLADPVLPWHSDRQRTGALVAAVALTAAALATIGRNVVILAQTEVGEVAEGTPGGSSAMPHKRNPARAVLVVAAAQQVPALASGVLSGMAGEAQRAIGGWQAEAPAVRQLLRLLGGAAEGARALLYDLRVDTARMRANVEARPAGAPPVTDAMLLAARGLIDRALAAR
ncbi:MAG TPA: lyase family protein [Micromonosporaceae bacterium]